MKIKHTIHKTKFEDNFVTYEPSKRAVKDIWSLEAENDLRTYHGIDIEKEMTARLIDEYNKIVKEVEESLKHNIFCPNNPFEKSNEE